MDVKTIIAALLDPKILAAAGGAASYYFMGRKKPGHQPYFFAAGGVVAGYLLGKVVQPLLAPQQAAALPTAAQAEAATTVADFAGEYVDLDAQAAPLALPPHEEPRAAAPAPAQRQAPPPASQARRRAAKPARTPVPDLMDSMGSFAGVGDGEDELGSYGGTFGDVDADIEAALKEQGRGKN